MASSGPAATDDDGATLLDQMLRDSGIVVGRAGSSSGPNPHPHQKQQGATTPDDGKEENFGSGLRRGFLDGASRRRGRKEPTMPTIAPDASSAAAASASLVLPEVQAAMQEGQEAEQRARAVPAALQALASGGAHFFVCGCVLVN